MNFEEASSRTKRRKVQQLVNEKSPKEIESAASLLAKRKLIESTNQCLTPFQALGLYYDLKLSVRRYRILRSVVNSLHPECFPNYKIIEAQKNDLIPKPIIVSELSAEVRMQDLLNQTASSLLKTIEIKNNISCVLECKYGFDGSSGHSVYKQKFSDENMTDEFLFIVAMVPLKMTNIDSQGEVWLNKTPSSVLFCRPIKLIFMQEKPSLIHNVEMDLMEQIERLLPFKTKVNDFNVEINFKLYLTMVDGAVTNVLAHNRASMNCYLCGATPSVMNSFHCMQRTIDERHLQYGLSTLHAWIKTFECLIHIAYRMPLKCWQVRGEENKRIFLEQKIKIQKEFRDKMGLIIDKVRTGYGTSNDGNTARRFFSNIEMVHEITNINICLLKNFSLILRTLSSGKKINTTRFSTLLKDTFKIYVDNFPWYNMPITVHKILIHGCEIIKNFNLPIGLLSEDALESSHKESRKYRLGHTRKNSRENCNRDLMAALLINSDPLISSNRHIAKTKGNDYKDLLPYIIEESTDADVHNSFISDINFEDFVSSDTSDETD